MTSTPLKTLSDNTLFVVEGEVKIPGAKLPSSMTILRLPDQSLLLHSPIAMDQATIDAIHQLGTVRYIVAPTLLHHLFVADAMKHFSSAQLLGVRGLAEKRMDLSFTGVLGDDSLKRFSDTLTVQPIDGMPSMNECVFFHHPSKTLIVTDLLFNVVQSPYFSTRMLLTLASGVYGRCAVSRLVKWSIKDRAAAGPALKQIIAWAPERLIMAHGEVLESNVPTTIERELSALL